MKKILIISILALCYSCSSKSADTNVKEESVDNKEYVSSAEKIFIPVTPSLAYSDSMRNALSEDEWMTLISDNEFYRDMTEQLLLKKGYKKVEFPTTEILNFKKQNGSASSISKKQVSNVWGNIIFNGTDDAFIYEGAMPEEDLKTKL